MVTKLVQKETEGKETERMEKENRHLCLVYHDGFPDGAGVENDSSGNRGIGVKVWE